MSTESVASVPPSSVSPQVTSPVADASPVETSGGLPLTLTPKAIEMAKRAIARRTGETAGLRLGVRGGGCSGVAYVIEFADKVRGRDHVFDFDGLSVIIDPKSLVYLRGTVLDYEIKMMQQGFKFLNPNEKGGCGCGESFSV